MDEIQIINVPAKDINKGGMNDFQKFTRWSSLFATNFEEVKKKWGNNHWYINEILNIIETKSEYNLLTTYPTTSDWGNYPVTGISFVFKKKKVLY